MALRTINSPGVEIREIDKSQYAPAIVGTSFLVMGYSDKGTEYIPLEIATLDDFETNFGVPTNEAERYFYYAAKEVLRSGANLVAGKLPYKNVISHNYKYMGITIGESEAITGSPTLSAMVDMQGVSGYFPNISEITLSSVQNIPTSGYDVLKAGNGFDPAELPDLGAYDFVIVNENKARITGPKSNEGIFTVIVDPIDALKVQRNLKGASDSDVFAILEGISYPSGVLYTDFSKPLTGTFVGQSVSEDLARMFPSIPFNFRNGATTLDKTYGQYIGIVVCQTRRDPNNDGKLITAYLEAYAGSIHSAARSPSTGQSIYIGDLINSQSSYIQFYQNLTTLSVPSINDQTVALWMPDAQYEMLGFTDAECLKYINGGQVVNDSKITMEKVSNIDEIQIDVVVDAGLSTIAQFTYDPISTSGSIYDPETDISYENSEINSDTQVMEWRSVCDELRAFSQDIRKDCMTILDVPRNLVIKGIEKYIRDTQPENTFSNTIGPRLQYVSGIDSSYAALYSNWMRMTDNFTGKPFWLPPTCKACGVYGYNDRVGNIWDAPAGLNRGVINGIFDLSFNPKSKESDQIYTKSINYAKRYRLDGFILEGQKTTQVKPSAFDRVNVRRLFLRLERLTYQVARYFVMEPNNAFTRRRLIDVLAPTFKAVQAAGGLYGFQLICDESNNKPETIDRNELRVAVVLQAVKTAEFIICDFIAVRTGQSNFTEAVLEAAGV
ncbi:MAG: phage tail sheath C-terminal domain-containing protein [Lentisphaerota bacterium]